MNFAHIDVNEDLYSLHDCIAEKINIHGGKLSFYFGDGLWVSPKHPCSGIDTAVRTDAARVDFLLESGSEDDITVYVFSKRRNGTTVREEWSAHELAGKVSSGEYRLEFLYQHKGYHSRIIDCWLWRDKKPYSIECQLYIRETGAEYCWNKLCEDRIW